MQKQPIRKAISLLIIVSLLLSVLPGSWTVNAVDEETIQISETNFGIAEPIQENTGITETISFLDADTVPEIIGYEEALNKNHVQRLYSDEGEDLNKVVFLNADGTKTMYLYDFPVKYVDIDGDVQDISLDIADTTAGFETASGSAVTTFATNISDGISLSGNGVDISLVPVLPVTVGTGTMASSASSAAGSAASRTATRIDSKTIAYPYDSKTTIEYSLTYTGFKEDIVVSEYTGQTEYVFRLYTNGYALTEIDGSFYLVDDTGNIKATIGDIIIFTADERNNTFGQLVPTTIVENEQYLLTIVVDADFLADEKTAYPIRIDPTLEINYDSNSSGIQDVTVSSGTTYSGTSGSLYVGLKEGAGICRALIKFPGLSALPSNVTVQSAALTMRDLMCQSTAMDIYCYTFNGNDWSESGATWSGTNAGSASSLGTHLCTVTMDYDIGVTYTSKHWYTFDITAAVRSWGNGSTGKGILLKMPDSHENGSTYTYRTIGSYNRSANKPTLSVTYSVEGGTIEVEEGKTVTLSASEISGTITWASSNTSIATVSSTGVVTGVRAGATTISVYSGNALQKTFTVRVLVPDGVYYVKNHGSGLYMAVENAGIIDGTDAVQENKQTVLPSSLFNMWKIKYMGNGRYSVRPMHKLDMALTGYGGYAEIEAVGTTDSLTYLDSTAQWTITYGANGYVFQCGGYSGSTVSVVLNSTSPGAWLVVTAYSNASLFQHWGLERITSPPSGVLFYNAHSQELMTGFSAHVVLERGKTLDQLGLIVAVYSGNTNSQAITWSSSNPSVASANSTTGRVYGYTSGSATITAYSSTAGVSRSYPLTVLSEDDSYYFTSYYDNGFQGISTSSITAAETFVDTAYFQLFNIGFGSSVPIYDGSLLSDRCPKDTNVPCDEICLASEDACHHKDIDEISTDLLNEKNPSAKNVAVLWSNRTAGTYCRESADGADHILMETEMAVTCGTTPVIHFMHSPEVSEEAHRMAMGITLAHERAHAFGVGEKYDFAGHDTIGDWCCVMERYEQGIVERLREFYQDVLLGEVDAFCSDCVDSLGATIN